MLVEIAEGRLVANVATSSLRARLRIDGRQATGDDADRQGRLNG